MTVHFIVSGVYKNSYSLFFRDSI
ncbi:MAG: hypothetical protein RLZZ205_556, partial [Bacteroidota bacterium]